MFELIPSPFIISKAANTSNLLIIDCKRNEAANIING